MTYEMPAGTRCPEDKTRINDSGKRVIPVGTEFEGGDVWKMLVHGCAEPVDDEAKQFLATKVPANTAGKLLMVHQSITEEFEDFQAEQEANEEDE